MIGITPFIGAISLESEIASIYTAKVSVTSCWRLADQGRKNELLGDSCWPAYGLSHTDDPLRHCSMHYVTLLFFSFFFFFFEVHIKRTSKKDQRQLLPVVKHLRTDGPQPIVLTSDADSLAAGGRPGADGPSNGRLKSV